MSDVETEPDRTNILAWIEALRSGEFKQGRNKLRTISHVSGKKYCCLGVAVELANRAGVQPASDRTFDGGHCPYDGPYADQDEADDHEHDLWCMDRSEEILPEEVSEWLGIEAANPVLGWDAKFEPEGELLSSYDVPMIDAAALNDILDTPFRDIARRVELVYIEGRAPVKWLQYLAEKGEDDDDA